MKKIKLNMKLSKVNSSSINRYIFYIIFSLLIGGLYFYTTRNYIFTIILFLIFNVFFFLLIDRIYLRFNKLDKKIHECISFINNFIITLSITKSLTSTYDSIYEGLSKELKERLNENDELNYEERLNDLSDYFNLNIYNFFLKTIKQYLNNGGDLINSSQLLIYDSRRIESSLDEFKSVSKRKLIEFSSLWGITMLILIVVQLALSMFYSSIINMSFYPIAVFMFFLVFMLFLFLIINKAFNLNFINVYREKVNDEKITI